MLSNEPTLEAGLAQAVAAEDLWVRQVAGRMAKAAARTAHMPRAEALPILEAALTQSLSGCTACGWMRDTFNEGSFDNFCGTTCPATSFCETVAWPVSGVLSAWQRAMGADGLDPYDEAACFRCSMFDVCGRTETATTRLTTCLGLAEALSTSFVADRARIGDAVHVELRRRFDAD